MNKSMEKFKSVSELKLMREVGIFTHQFVYQVE